MDKNITVFSNKTSKKCEYLLCSKRNILELKIYDIFNIFVDILSNDMSQENQLRFKQVIKLVEDKGYSFVSYLFKKFKQVLLYLEDDFGPFDGVCSFTCKHGTKMTKYDLLYDFSKFGGLSNLWIDVCHGEYLLSLLSSFVQIYITESSVFANNVEHIGFLVVTIRGSGDGWFSSLSSKEIHGRGHVLEITYELNKLTEKMTYHKNNLKLYRQYCHCYDENGTYEEDPYTTYSDDHINRASLHDPLVFTKEFDVLIQHHLLMKEHSQRSDLAIKTLQKMMDKSFKLEDCYK